jgi:hypothetical protein
MKVIKGSTDEQWKVQVTCESCEAVLEVEKKDLYVANTAVAYAGETWDPRIRVRCCVCETPVPMDGHVPWGIQARMFTEARQKALGR